MKGPLSWVFMIISALCVSGCTTSDWIQAAGGVMQARDSYDKKARGEKIKRANAAAARVKK